MFKIVKAADTDPAAISPKVARPAWVTLLLAALTAILGALTPEMFAFLGDFAGPAFLVVGAVMQAVIGYFTADPRLSDGKHVDKSPSDGNAVG